MCLEHSLSHLSSLIPTLDSPHVCLAKLPSSGKPVRVWYPCSEQPQLPVPAGFLPTLPPKGLFRDLLFPMRPEVSVHKAKSTCFPAVSTEGSARYLGAQ